MARMSKHYINSLVTAWICAGQYDDYEACDGTAENMDTQSALRTVPAGSTESAQVVVGGRRYRHMEYAIPQTQFNVVPALLRHPGGQKCPLYFFFCEKDN